MPLAPLLGDGADLCPPAANDNRFLKPSSETPLQALAWVRQARAQELKKNRRPCSLARLRRRRYVWQVLQAHEDCLLWTYFRR